MKAQRTALSPSLPWARVPSLALASVVCAMGCAESAASGGENVLVVAADVGFAPHVMLTPDGTPEGFNVDLAREVARRLGYDDVEIIDQEWSVIFAGLYAQRYEFIVAPTTMTDERSEAVLFTEGYLDTDFTFVIRADAPDIESLEDLRGHAIAVNNGSAYDFWATDNQERYGFEIQRYGKNADAVQAVLTGRAFTNLAGNTVAQWAAMENPRVRTTYTISTGTAFSMPFRHQDVAYRNKVEDILECMKVDGTFSRLHEEWFGEPPAEGAAAVTVLEGYGHPGMSGYDPTPHELRCEAAES